VTGNNGGDAQRLPRTRGVAKSNRETMLNQIVVAPRLNGHRSLSGDLLLRWCTPVIYRARATGDAKHKERCLEMHKLTRILPISSTAMIDDGNKLGFAISGEMLRKGTADYR
jgi:hypothetical protein